MIEVQHAWDIKIVLDLTFGGMGVAAFILGFISYLKGEKDFGIRVGFAGMASLLVGLLILMSHLGKPEAAIYAVLTPNLGSVMTWGIFFNVFTLLFGGLFSLPAIIKLPYASNEKVMKALGTLGCVFSFLVMSYTGTLLSVSSIHLWRSPATPLLFILVAFSSGVGLYCLVAYILKKDVPLTYLDFSMITTFLALVTTTLYLVEAGISTEAYKYSIDLWLSELLPATLLLYLGGYLAPLAIYLLGKRRLSKNTLLAIALLLILQSFLARLILLYAGAVQLPW